MAQVNPGTASSVAGQDTLSYLNPFGPATVLRVTAQRNPTTADRRFKIGTVWINQSTNVIWMLSSVVTNSATWVLAGPGSSDVDSLTPDGGTSPVVPAAGTITLAGGTNITTVGGLNTMTFNLDPAITLATSVTSPLYTAGAGTDTVIEAVAGQNIVLNMSDAAGAQKVSFTDSADVEVFSVDSNGSIGMLAGLTVTGAFTQTAGVVSISEDNSANAVGIGNGTVARTIDIGSSAAAHVITMGSTTGAAQLDLLAGTGNFSLTGATATTIDIGLGLTTGTISIGDTGNTGTMTISPSTAAQTVNIANANGAKTINIGNGVDGNSISVGNGINTSAQTVNIANGASGADSTVNIFSGTATAGTQTLNVGNGEFAKAINVGNGALGNTILVGNGDNSVAQTVSISNGASAANSTVNVLSGTGTAGAGILNLANNTRVTTVDIADIAPAAPRTINVCGGNGAQNDTFNLMTGNPSANAQTVNILSGVPSGGTQTLNLLTQTGQAGTVNMATGAAMANNINVGGTGANTIAIGNTQTGGSVSVGDAMTTGTITIGGSGAHTGTMTVAGGTGAQTLNIANSTGGKTVNVATGAGANAVTIGSTNTTSSLTLQSGSGEITVTGTVKEIDAEFLSRSGDDVTFQASPVLTTAANTGGAPTGATGNVNLMNLQEGIVMEQFILGAGQTIIAPRMDSNGLLVSLDLTSLEGAEYNFGAARTNSRHAFTIGTSAAFFAEWRFRINDMDGAAPYVCGFRKVEANNATFGNYTDYAAIGMIAASSTTNIVTVTELNSGGQTVTDTTDAWGGDGSTNTLRVLVDASGNVTYTINGSAPSASVAFQFDATDVVVPFFRLEHSASPTEVEWVSMKIGFQA